MLPLVAASTATLATTLTVTVPDPDGVISAVYVVPLPAKFPIDPPITPISPTTKPVTASLKVIVTGIGEIFVGSVELDVMVTVGATLSNTLVRLVAAVFPFVAASVATFEATLTVTVPCPVGVILAV